jgi:hypothetical protein
MTLLIDLPPEQSIEIQIETSGVLLAVHFTAIMHGSIDASFTLYLTTDNEPPKKMLTGIFREMLTGISEEMMGSVHTHFAEFFLNLPPDTHNIRVDYQCTGQIIIENPVLTAYEIGGPRELDTPHTHPKAIH